MIPPVLTYLAPAWGLIPTKEQTHKSKVVHVRVQFSDDAETTGPDILHSFELPWGAPLQEPEYVYPMVVVNPIAGGVLAPAHVVTFKSGNILSISRCASGVGTSVTYDVWILHPKAAFALFG